MTDPASVNVTATPATTAHMVPTGAPYAFLRHDPADSDSKKHRLYTVIGQKRVKSRILESKSQHCEALSKKTDEIWEKGHILMKKYWHRNQELEFSIGRLRITSKGEKPLLQKDFRAKIQELIKNKYSNVSQLQIDFEAQSVSFVKDGKSRLLKGDELGKELPGVKDILDFVSLWQEAHETAMLIMGIRNWHEDLRISTNRPIHGVEPFVIKDNPRWDLFIPKTHEDFEKNHLSTLRSKKPDAEGQIQKTHQFIEKFKQEISNTIKQKEAAQPTPEEELKILKKMKEKLEAMNLYAIYWAVAYGDNPDIAQASKDLTSDLSATLNDRFPQDWERPFKHGFAWANVNPTNSNPSEEDLKIFAAQAGELLDHDGSFAHNFKKKAGPCAEEWVVHRMLNTGTKSFHDDLAGFAIPDNLSSLKEEIRAIALKSST